MTVPDPLPLAPDVTVIHEVDATAVHEQPVPAETPKLLDPPILVALPPGGLSV